MNGDSLKILIERLAKDPTTKAKIKAELAAEDFGLSTIQKLLSGKYGPNPGLELRLALERIVATFEVAS